MKVIVLQPTIIGGVDYQPSLGGEYTNIPDHIAEHMVSIGNATPYETKVLETLETKVVVEKKSLSVSPLDPVLPVAIAPRRRGRPPKSLL